MSSRVANLNLYILLVLIIHISKKNPSRSKKKNAPTSRRGTGCIIYEDFNLKDETPVKFISAIKKNLNSSIIDMNWDLDIQSVKISSMWAIINEQGAWNQKHQHSNSDISAAYYVSAHENCGDIVFYDPRPSRVYKYPIAKSPNKLNATVNSIKPEPGMLVLFPSYLDHSVNPNLSEKKRVVISFNLSLEKN